MITLYCCHPGKNAWSVILFFLPHNSSASLATCIFMNTLFSILLPRIMWLVTKKKIWFHSKSSDLVAQDWLVFPWTASSRSHFPTKMEDSLWNSELLLGKTIKVKHQKQKLVTVRDYLTTYSLQVWGLGAAVHSPLPRASVMHSLPVLFASPRMVNSVRWIFWFCSMRNREFPSALWAFWSLTHGSKCLSVWRSIQMIEGMWGTHSSHWRC